MRKFFTASLLATSLAVPTYANATNAIFLDQANNVSSKKIPSAPIVKYNLDGYTLTCVMGFDCNWEEYNNTKSLAKLKERANSMKGKAKKIWQDLRD